MKVQEFKVSQMAINQCLKKYEQEMINEQDEWKDIPHTLVRINGIIFHKVDMSTEEFCEKLKLKSIDDIKWCF